MPDALADGLAAAGQVAGATDRGAFLEATGVVVLTITVCKALNGLAGQLGVAIVARFAGANGPVVDDRADGVPATGAGVLTDGVDAGLRVVTLIVSLTARHNGRKRDAAASLVGGISLRTDADHGADGRGVDDLAARRGHAWREERTGVLALGLNTCQLVGTVAVLHTLGRGQREAVPVGVSGVADLAATLGHVVADEALGMGGRAGVLPGARVDAVTAVARLLLGALRVRSAADWRAAGIGIALEALQAAAVGPVATRVALGIGAAWVIH